MQSSPLIITLKLNDASHNYFTQLRDQYFPGHCNYLQAHLTLFHHLPADNLLISESLELLAKRPPFNLEINSIKSIGNGVAYTVASDHLKMLHKSMQQSFKDFLISQDKQALWPHITIQNKVTAFKAKQTLDVLSKDFTPFSIKGIGFSTWLYLKGPWEHRKDYIFDANG